MTCILLLLSGALVLHDLLVDFPYRQAAHFGIGHFSKALGNVPDRAIALITLKGTCPSL